uniref:Uncharacterized protein n=1 Tax=Cacopsylla melanoneura TaxID=428564 RepID=A0A8D8TIM9_9HEMI
MIVMNDSFQSRAPLSWHPTINGFRPFLKDNEMSSFETKMSRFSFRSNDSFLFKASSKQRAKERPNPPRWGANPTPSWPATSTDPAALLLIAQSPPCTDLNRSHFVPNHNRSRDRAV